jgi:hypothetical protein
MVKSKEHGEVFKFPITPMKAIYEAAPDRTAFLMKHSFREEEELVICNIDKCEAMITRNNAHVHIIQVHSPLFPTQRPSTEKAAECPFCQAAIYGPVHFQRCPNLQPWTKWTCKLCLKECNGARIDNFRRHFTLDTHFRSWLGFNGKGKGGCRARLESWVPKLLRVNRKAWPKARKDEGVQEQEEEKNKGEEDL